MRPAVEQDLDLARLARDTLGLHLNESQVRAFDRYARELQAWNRRVNLTAITNPQQIVVKHFLDSLTCLRAMARREGRLVDVGTGAGFPGLPLKVVCPRLRVTLVEATGKKVEFCRYIVDLLGLEGVEVVHGRAEAVAHDPAHRQAYDWAVARAVAVMPVLAEYLLPFVRLGGQAIAMKGETGPAEAAEAEAALRVLGGRVRQLIPIELPLVPETRYLVVVDKVAATPETYPRRPGVPAKRPLRR